MKKKPVSSFFAALTLTPIFGGLLLFIWGASADYTGVKAAIRTKASKSDVVKLHNKIDKVIIGLCLINSKACILKEEEEDADNTSSNSGE